MIIDTFVALTCTVHRYRQNLYIHNLLINIESSKCVEGNENFLLRILKYNIRTLKNKMCQTDSALKNESCISFLRATGKIFYATDFLKRNAYSDSKVFFSHYFMTITE